MQGLFNMAGDSAHFRAHADLSANGFKLDGNTFVGRDGRFLPLLEAKMVHSFDHRFGTYEGATEAHLNKGFLPLLSDADHADPAKSAIPLWWVAAQQVDESLGDRWAREWFLGWRDITNVANARTFIPTLVPRTAIGHTLPLMFPNVEPQLVAALYANLCSFALDYAARQKVGGMHVTYGLLKQFPVLAPGHLRAKASWDRSRTVCEWALGRVLELTFTAWDLGGFASDVGYIGPPFRWDPERRFLLRAELNAAFFHLYGISHDDADYILETFPIVKKNDEKAHGEYRTKHVILEIYDAMAEAIRTGKPFQTRLDPPPADPRVAHPPRPEKV
jgi:hypothetical protein